MRVKLFNFLILFLVPLISLAGEKQEKGKFTKEKKISKSYLVNSNAGLDVTNRYGSIYVTTWNEDKIAIDVVIMVSGNSEDQVNRRINSIDVEFEAAKNLVTAKTEVGNFNGGRTCIEINYTIKIPLKGSIRLDNQYGNIKTGKIYGKADIEGKYGDLFIEELNGDNNKLDIEYCNNSKVGFMKNGSLSAGYSGLNLAKTSKLTANCEYTRLKIDDIDDLTYRCEYGNLAVGNVDKITGTGEYMPINIGRVNSLLNITTDYGNLQVSHLTKNVKNVAVNATYASVNMKYAEDYAFDFEVTTEYNRLNGGSDLKFQEKIEKPTEAYYKGYHKSSGVNRLFIKSEYGHVNLYQL